MRTATKTIGIAAVTAAALAIGVAAPANAAHWHRGGGGFGPGFVGGLAVGAAVGSAPYYYGGGPYYAYDSPYYASDCYVRRQVVVDRWGNRIIRNVRECD
jgi:hypothetical protein